MLIQLLVRHEGSGFLDAEGRDGDVLLTKPDTFEMNFGSQDKKSFLILKVPDPPNMAAVEAALVESEYEVGQSADETVVRRYRKYTLPWRNAFTAEEKVIIDDSNAMLPDGQLSSGGTVTSGVVSGKFTIADFVRK